MENQPNPADKLLMPSAAIRSNLASQTGPTAVSGKSYIPRTERFTSTPKNYSFASPQPNLGETGAVAPSSSTRFANMPAHLSGGQYAQDPTQSGKLVKSERELGGSMTNAFLRDGLSSRFYQIDHIMPLWAGGTDTMANRQMLSKKEHDKKSKVGAVARKLYYSGEIKLGEARTMSLNWQNRDTAGIEVNKQGDTSLETAKRKIEEWKAPPKVKWKDILSSMKEGPKGTVGELAQATLSGLTGGWIPAGEHEYKDRGEQMQANVARFVGQTAGTIGSFVLLGGLVRGAAAVTGLGKLAKASSVGKKIWGANTAIRTRGITVPTQRVSKVFENMGLFALHGQLSKQHQNDFEGRTKRFLSDISMGALVGTAGHSWKGYAGLGLGTYTLSMLEGADEEDALINAAVMMGLHGMGYSGKFKKNAKTKAYLEKETTKVATEQINKWIKEPIKEPKRGEKVLEIQKLAEAEENIVKKVEDGSYDPDMAIQEWNKIKVASKHLFNKSLGREATIKEEVNDLIGVGQKFSSNGPGQFTMGRRNGLPNRMISFVDKNQELASTQILPTQKLPKLNTEVPDGRVWFTGVSEEISPTIKKNYGKFQEAIDSGKARKRILVVDRADIEGIMNKVNKDPKRKVPSYKNPDKNLEAFGYIEGEGYIPLGYVPREIRIDGKNYKNSQNNRVRQLNEQSKAKFGDEAILLEEFDPKLNKNTLSDKMRELGLDAMEMEVEAVKHRAIESSEPYLIGKFTKENWQEAVAKKQNNMEVRLDELSRAPAAKEISKYVDNSSFNSNAGPKFVQMLASKVEDVMFAAKSPKELRKGINSFLGDVVDMPTATRIYNGRSPVKVSQVMDWLNTGATKNKLSPNGKDFYQLSRFFMDNLDPNVRGSINNIKLNRFKGSGEIKQVIQLGGEKPRAWVSTGDGNGYMIYQDGRIDHRVNSYRGKDFIMTEGKREATVREIKKRYPEMGKTLKRGQKALPSGATLSLGTPGAKSYKDAMAKFQQTKATGDKAGMRYYEKIIDAIKDREKMLGFKGPKKVKSKKFSMEEMMERKLDVMGEKRTSEVKNRDKYRNISQEDKFRDAELNEMKDSARDNIAPELQEDVVRVLRDNNARLSIKTINKIKKNSDKLVKKKEAGEDIDKDIMSFVPKGSFVGGTATISKYQNISKITGNFNPFAKEIINSAKTAKDPKVKYFWTEVINILNDKNKTWHKPGVSIKGKKLASLQADEYPAWHAKMPGKEMTVDSAIKKLTSWARTYEYDKLPKDIADKIKAHKKKHPQARVISSPTEKKYNPNKFYNVYPDIRMAIKKKEPWDYFKDEKLTDSEKADLVGRTGQEVETLLGNIKTKERLSEQETISILSNALAPLDNIEKLSKEQIKPIADDLANLISQILSKKK